MLPALLISYAFAALAPSATPPDVMTQMPGGRVELPFRIEGRIEAGTCLELRALETGADIELKLVIGSAARLGADGGVVRHGMQMLVECAETPRSFVADIVAIDANASARWSQRVVTAADGERYAALRDFATVSARYAVAAEAASVAAGLITAAQRFDAIGDVEHAAIAWTFAAARAGASGDRELAAQAFDAALARTETLGWTRYRVVLLNDRAWFLATVDPPRAQALIDASFALQAQLRDPKLAATIENNVCLLRHQHGALGQAEACFARVLERQIALDDGASAIGATRNNIALVQFTRGRYRDAEAGFRLAARERLSGGDKAGHAVSLCNIALALYQLGEPEAALLQLQEAYAAAAANADRVGRATAASFIASIYLAWGDAETAFVYATEAEGEFRALGRIANRAPAMRLLARIALERGDRDAALAIIQEAWQFAVTHQLHQAAANIASVHAQILVERGEFAEAQMFIADARARLLTYFGTADLVSLDIVEIRLMRELGRIDAARLHASSLDKRLALPGLSRSRLLIERQLVENADGARDTAALRRSYGVMIDDLRHGVVVAPDPELALRMQELARPAAEAAIAREFAACADAAVCASQSLRRALEFFALEPRFVARGGMAVDDLPTLLQALSQLQARDDRTMATAELIATIKRRQAASRRQRAVYDADDCAICRQVDADRGDLVYFFGAARGWRWQRIGNGWRAVELPRWETLAAALRASADPPQRRRALRVLAPLVAGLATGDRDTLVVAGDPRLLRIPFSALPLTDDELVIDRYSVQIVASNARAPETPQNTVSFADGGDTSSSVLPMVEEERRTFVEWAQRHSLAVAALDADSRAPLTLLHLAAHGQRDLGAGLSVLWLKDGPLLSYLSPRSRVAQTVVINGCDSGAAPERGLAQASIAAAFLRGGARRVVATLYPVPDLVAANFSRAFYARYEPDRGNVADAVRHAQLELRRGPNHQDAWAAYVTVIAGDGTMLAQPGEIP